MFMYLENFLILEEKLRKLLKITKDLLEEHERMVISLKQKDLQIEGMKKELEELRRERDNIKKEVDEIIEKIEAVL